MDDGSRSPIIIAVILLFCAAYFAITETALASVSRNKIKTAAERGDNRAKKALYALDNFELAISTLLICTNIVHIAAATLVTVAVTRRWGLEAVSISTIITTIIVFFAGEMLPKSIAKKYSEKLILSTAGGLCIFMKVFAPLAALLSFIGQAVAKLTSGDSEITVTEDEIYDIIEDMTEDGSLNEEQGELISSALQFGDVTVESILTPRVDVVGIDVNDSVQDILNTVKQSNHSRFPVYEKSVDKIIGFLQIRKFLKAYLREGDALDIRSILDEVFFIHQSTNIDELLPLMSKKKLNIAVVTDNFGGTLGIVTVEDILEELVGEIWDEDDVIEEPIIELGDGNYRVDADESVADTFDRIGFEDPEEDEELVNTLMGEWVYEQFAVLPKIGDSFSYHELSVTVSAMDNNRILNVIVHYVPTDDEEGVEK